MLQIATQYTSQGSYSLTSKKIAINIGGAANGFWTNTQYAQINPLYRTRPGNLVPESAVPANRWVHSVHDWQDQIRPMPIQTIIIWMPLDTQDSTQATTPSFVGIGQLQITEASYGDYPEQPPTTPPFDPKNLVMDDVFYHQLPTPSYLHDCMQADDFKEILDNPIGNIGFVAGWQVNGTGTQVITVGIPGGDVIVITATSNNTTAVVTGITDDAGSVYNRSAFSSNSSTTPSLRSEIWWAWAAGHVGQITVSYVGTPLTVISVGEYTGVMVDGFDLSKNNQPGTSTPVIGIVASDPGCVIVGLLSSQVANATTTANTGNLRNSFSSPTICTAMMDNLATSGHTNTQVIANLSLASNGYCAVALELRPVSVAYHDWLDEQFRNFDYLIDKAQADDQTELVTLPPLPPWDHDGDNQKLQPGFTVDEDVVDASVEQITLNPLGGITERIHQQPWPLAFSSDDLADTSVENTTPPPFDPKFETYDDYAPYSFAQAPSMFDPEIDNQEEILRTNIGNIGFVAGWQINGSGTQILQVGIPAGDLIVVTSAAANSGASVNSVTDDAGTTYYRAAFASHTTTTPTLRAEVWWGRATAHVSLVTVSYTGTPNVVVAVADYIGVVVDGTDSGKNNNAGTSTPTVGIVTSDPGCVVVGVLISQVANATISTNLGVLRESFSNASIAVATMDILGSTAHINNVISPTLSLASNGYCAVALELRPVSVAYHDWVDDNMHPFAYTPDNDLADSGVENIIIPVIITDYTYDNDAEQQIPIPGYKLDDGIADPNVELITLASFPSYRHDGDNQKQQPGYALDDGVADYNVERITLASFPSFDHDADHQLPTPAFATDRDLSDSSVELITLPPFIDIVEDTSEAEDE